MLRQELSLRYSKLFNFIYIGSAFGVVLLTAILRAEPNGYKDNWPVIYSFINFSRPNAWWALPLFTILTGVSQQIKTAIGTFKTWELVQYVLNGFQDEMFGKDDEKKEDPEFYHRITLYKFVRFRWFILPGGWLVPVARSGSSTRTKISVFKASRDEPEKAEGVAGKTWAGVSKRIPVYDLPNIGIENPSDEDIRIYSERTWVTEKWIRKQIKKKNRGSTARSILGIPVEAKGKRWGVLVVDSRRPEQINVKPILRSVRYNALSGVLDEILEKL